MTLGKDTFGINKTEFNQKIGRIIKNFRANSKLIGEPKEFVLRCCKLCDQWSKMANDPEVLVYLRNIEIASGRKIKLISLERGNTRQPVPKAKLVDALYPPKKTIATATPEEKHYNAVKAAMRGGVLHQLKERISGQGAVAHCLFDYGEENPTGNENGRGPRRYDLFRNCG